MSNVTNHCQLSKSINHHRQEHLCYCQSNLYHCFVVVTTMSLLTTYLTVSSSHTCSKRFVHSVDLSCMCIHTSTPNKSSKQTYPMNATVHTTLLQAWAVSDTHNTLMLSINSDYIQCFKTAKILYCVYIYSLYISTLQTLVYISVYTDFIH